MMMIQSESLRKPSNALYEIRLESIQLFLMIQVLVRVSGVVVVVVVFM